MAGIVRQEWLDQNAGRAYPFAEDMARMPTDQYGNVLGSAALPNYVIVDMIMTVPGSALPRLYMSQLTYVGDLLTLVFRETAGDTIVASVSVDLHTHTPNKAYAVQGLGSWYDAQGWVVVGHIDRLRDDLPEGLYTYPSTQTLLECRVVRPSARGVRSLRISNNGNISDYLYDHVKLVAGNNIRLEYDADDNAIWIHAEPNAGYREPCPCDATELEPVTTINGINIGNVVIVGDGDCVNVRTEGNKIVISDTCSKPCCGCPELDYLNTTTKVIESSLGRLESYAQKLADRISAFTTNFVLSVGV